MKPSEFWLRETLKIMSGADIGRYLGVSKQRVDQWCQSYGFRVGEVRLGRAAGMKIRKPQQQRFGLFQRGDVVVSSDLSVRSGIHDGRRRTGVVAATPRQNDIVSVRLDGTKWPVAYSVAFWTLKEK